MTRLPSPVRVALSGCGAVAQRYYAPALQALELEGLVRVVGAHDPDPTARRQLSATFPRARPATGYDALLATSPALVVVASPPQHHPDQAIAALTAGIDVHCEKPLATSLAEGERMVAAAEAAGRTLTVGMVRRQLPATLAIRQLIAAGAIGPVASVDCFEGGPFDWPVSSPGYFRGGGGVLHDIGTHCLDLLGWWLGPPSSVAYEDDAMGGVEANCRIALTFGEARATVRLSRDWSRPNRYLVTGRDGWLGWTVNEADQVELGIAGTGCVGDLHLRPAAASADGSVRHQVPDGFHRAFVDQLRALVAPAEGRRPPVSGAEALTTTALVERCIAVRRPMPMPWLTPDGGT